MTRYVEVDASGMVIHAPDPLTTFVTAPPPAEVLFCDCLGIGRICHHIYRGEKDHPDPQKRVDRHYDITGATVSDLSRADFLTRHSGPKCKTRRQFFVDVTTRPDAQLGMHYDEKTDTFSV